MSVHEWHILEADSIRADACRWWKPNSQGYTTNLDEAGLYTEDEAREMERSSGHDSIAVHRDHAREASVPTSGSTPTAGRISATEAARAYVSSPPT